MPQDNPPLLDKTMNTTEQTPRNLADVLASGLASIANNVKPDGSDISIDVPGMSATNVNDGFSELKQSLDGLLTSESRTGTTNANGGISLGLYLAHPVLVVIPKTTNANVYAFVVATSGGMQWAMFKNADGSSYASQSIDFDIVYR